MLNLIIMGQIPGTNVQLSFYAFLLLISLLLGIGGLYSLNKNLISRTYRSLGYYSLSVGSGRILSPYKRSSSNKNSWFTVKLGRFAISPIRLK